MHNKILIVDDDPDIREVLHVLLESEGYKVTEAEEGETALKIIKADNSIDLVILDIMMPGMTGIEVCSEIRKQSSVPVLFLTAKSQDTDKIQAYTEGGDDFLVKPFSNAELTLKVKALIRRYKQYAQLPINNITALDENISINAKTRVALKGGKRVALTDKEFDILQFLLDKRGEVVENRVLYEGVWGEKYLPSAGNTIMVHILNLRKKLEQDVNNPKIIKTVWGKGYKIE